MSNGIERLLEKAETHRREEPRRGKRHDCLCSWIGVRNGRYSQILTLTIEASEMMRRWTAGLGVPR